MSVWVPHGLATEEVAVIAGVASPVKGVVLHSVDVEHCMRGKGEREKTIWHYLTLNQTIPESQAKEVFLSQIC